ncbi:MAG: asparagine synthase-related protein [Vicinamibacterales bacterium]
MRLDDAPLDPRLPARVQEVMSSWGPDGVRVWSAPGAMLGQAVLADTPEAVHEDLPAADPGGFVFTAEGRLDNRHEVAGALGLSPAAHRDLADGVLARLAYARWGVDAPERLIGDWSFAAWHPAERRLVIARDHHGTTALHYRRDGAQVLFASDLRAIGPAAGLSCTLDERYVAQLLLAAPAFQGAATAYREIRRLPPAHLREFTPTGDLTRRYWRPEETPELRLRGQEEYAEALRETFTRAVGDMTRHRGGVGVTLSGGLDSGAVAAVAAGSLARRGEALTALTFMPAPGDRGWVAGSELFDEWAGAAATARFAGIRQHLDVRADTSPIAELRAAVDTYGEPLIAAPNIPMIHALCRAAGSAGVRCVLTGQGGNGTITYGGDPGRLPLGRLLRRGPCRALAGRVLPAPLHAGLRSWLARRALGLGGGEPRWRAHSALSVEAFDRLRLGEAAVEDELAAHARSAGALAYIRPGRYAIGAFWARAAAAHGLVFRDPTHDPRVIARCLSVPDCWWGLSGDRALGRAVLRGMLPDEVRLAVRRGQQSADLPGRLVAHYGDLRDALAWLDGSAAVHALVDLRQLSRVADELRRRPHPETTARVAAVLMRGLSAGFFLKSLD